MKRVVVYVHGSRDSMYEQGEELGLIGEALRMFSFAASELKLDLEVNEVTGEAEIVAVDGRALAPREKKP